MPLFQQNFDQPINVKNPGNGLAEMLSGALEGVQTGQSIKNNYYKNLMDQAKVPYASRMSKAEAEAAEAKPGLMNAQTKKLDFDRENPLLSQSGAAGQIGSLEWLQNKFGKGKSVPDYINLLNQSITADTNYKSMGGGRAGVSSKDEMLYRDYVSKDNPQFNGDPDKIWQASNIIKDGGRIMPDGSTINVSTNTLDQRNRAYRGTTTTGLINKGVQANQAEAELGEFNKLVTPVYKEMGTTYLNKSPEALVASFSNDAESQRKLGRIIGARSLQYPIAQLRNRIDMGEPGIKATEELMQNSGQVIDALYPRITPAARLAAQEFINNAVSKALMARNKYGIGASGASGNPNNNEKPNDPLGIL